MHLVCQGILLGHPQLPTLPISTRCLCCPSNAVALIRSIACTSFGTLHDVERSESSRSIFQRLIRKLNKADTLRALKEPCKCVRAPYLKPCKKNIPGVVCAQFNTDFYQTVRIDAEYQVLIVKERYGPPRHPIRRSHVPTRPWDYGSAFTLTVCNGSYRRPLLLCWDQALIE